MVKKIKIFNSDVEYEVDYRNVKYPRLEFKTGKLHLILPRNYEGEDKLLHNHKKWILKKYKLIGSAIKASKKKKLNNLSVSELKRLIVDYIDDNSKLVKPNRVAFKTMKSKWGSCSTSKTLTFNTLLRYLPRSLIQYVVYHEITHLREKKHNSKFWNLVSKKFKNYRSKEKDLFIYWFLIQETKSKKN